MREDMLILTVFGSLWASFFILSILYATGLEGVKAALRRQPLLKK